MIRHRSPFAWPGGKRLLTKTLLTLIPEHHIYVEVFSGSAKLLFAKPPSPREVINDVNGDLVNFFRVAKHRPAALAEMFEHELVAAERFREWMEAQPEDELSRATRFAYLTWYSYGAKGEHFASSNAKQCLGTHARRSLERVHELLQQTSVRLRSVLVEQRDFLDVLLRYDSRDTWFYLDPPYVDFQNNARYPPLDKSRRAEMFHKLADLQGKFLMSFDDCQEIRLACELHGFKTRAVGVGYSLCSSSQARAISRKELLISNYRFAAARNLAGLSVGSAQ